MSATEETSSELSPAPSGDAGASSQGQPENEEEWRAPGRHYLVGIGCFGLVVLSVVAFYVWRFAG